MKKHILLITILFCLLIPIFLTAQVETIYPSKPQTKPKPQTESTANKLVLKVAPNMQCRIKLDGEDKGVVDAGGIKKVYLHKGEFKIEVISTENNSDVFSARYIVNVEDINSEKLLEVDLLEIRNNRIAKEQAELRKKQEAKQKAKADSIAKVNAFLESLALLDEIEKNMVFVQGGTFTMGCTTEQGSDCYDSEKPAHSVTVSNYYIGKYEVTQKQWREVMGASTKLSNPSYFSGCDDCPVEQVSWDDIQEFLNKLNAKTGKTYILPTEAQWEYAARGGNKSSGYKYAGSNSIESVAWYNDNSSSKTHPVGQKAPNELGIYDMSGNVWEWCNDWYGNYSSSSQTNPTGASSGSNRLLRGGSWYSSAQYCRSSDRGDDAPDYRGSNRGFRLVRVP